jgi:hypothetical protein
MSDQKIEPQKLLATEAATAAGRSRVPVPGQKPDDPADNAPQQQSKDVSGWFATQSKIWRRKAIEITPPAILNNATNILSASHVATEGMMFKSAMPEGSALVKNKGNPINWVKEPVQTVFTETFRKAKAHDVKELFKGNFFKNVYHRVTDLDDAVDRFHARPENLGKNAKLLSSWQFRTTFAGLVVWSLTTLIPESKESDEEVERMSIKRQVNPVGYVAERLKQAVWFPEWHKHKSQLLGLGYTIIGACSIIGSWRGRGTNAAGKDVYVFNSGYLGTSIVSLLCSIPLLFASDEKNAYGGYGTVMMGRLLFLPKSITQKFKSTPERGPDPGRHWYLGSVISFQIENLIFALIGGAEKRPDGQGGYTIVDHTEIREQARQKAHQLRLAKSRGDTGRHSDNAIGQPGSEMPANKISGATALERVQDAPQLQGSV